MGGAKWARWIYVNKFFLLTLQKLSLLIWTPLFTFQKSEGLVVRDVDPVNFSVC